MENIDLHTLRLFSEIYETGSLSRTAIRLGLTQPAVSIALGRLRRRFDDALFVRVGNTMEATPQAEGMIQGIRSAIAALELTLAYRDEFDPARTDRLFRIAMTDIGQIVLLAQLLDAFALHAPHAQLTITNITEQTPHQLMTGELDVALGYVPQLNAGYFMQTFFREQFACLVKAEHPRIHDRLTMRQYQTESHIVVPTSGTGHFIVDRTLEEMQVVRKIAVRVPGHLGLATIVGHTEHICTLPRRAAMALAAGGAVKTFPVPFELPEYAVKLHWHERVDRDPGNRWLRVLLQKLFQG